MLVIKDEEEIYEFFQAIPCTTPIYGGFNHGGVVNIHGELMQGPHKPGTKAADACRKICATFGEGTMAERTGQKCGFVVEFPSRAGIALHMSVRMGMHGTEHCIVLNNMRSGAWQIEERHQNVFFFGQRFHLHIECHQSHYTLHVNGQHIAHFYHREDPQHVTACTLRGDVKVDKIHFEHFIGMNGGGVQIGSGVVVSSPPPVVVMAPRPTPVVEVVIPPRRPIIEVVAPRRPLFAPVVVLNTGNRHRRHH